LKDKGPVVYTNCSFHWSCGKVLA